MKFWTKSLFLGRQKIGLWATHFRSRALQTNSFPYLGHNETCQLLSYKYTDVKLLHYYSGAYLTWLAWVFNPVYIRFEQPSNNYSPKKTQPQIHPSPLKSSVSVETIDISNICCCTIYQTISSCNVILTREIGCRQHRCQYCTLLHIQFSTR